MYNESGFWIYENVEILPDEDVRALIVKSKAGDKQATGRILANYRKFIIHIIKNNSRFTTNTDNWAEMDDLVQVGWMGVLKAIQKFDLSYPNKFSSYAVHWIFAALRRYRMNEHSLVKFGTTNAERVFFSKYPSAMRELDQAGIEITPTSLAGRMGLTVEECEYAYFKYINVNVLSLNEHVTKGRKLHDSHDSIEFIDRMADKSAINPVEAMDDSAQKALFMKKLNEFIGTIVKPVDLDIIYKIWLNHDPLTFRALGEKYGVSRQNMQMKEKRLKLLLKQFIENPKSIKSNSKPILTKEQFARLKELIGNKDITESLVAKSIKVLFSKELKLTTVRNYTKRLKRERLKEVSIVSIAA